MFTKFHVCLEKDGPLSCFVEANHMQNRNALTTEQAEYSLER